SLLGSLVVAQLESAALARAAQPEQTRRPFCVLADEFQNFNGDAFERILTECRKYAIWCCLAHQHLEQIGPQLRNAIFACAATHLLFSLSPTDQAIVS